MIEIRKSEDRGHAHHGWLNARHTFSFAHYYDPRFTGFHDLLVINEDRVSPNSGFATHGHRDMEIITYVLEGALVHQDSLGSGSTLRPGDVQRMSAGTGVKHSEMNPSGTDELHLLQIWIQPKKIGVVPSYEEKHFPDSEKKNQFKLIVSPNGREDSLRMNQEVSIYAALMDPAYQLEYALQSHRAAWIQVARGSVQLNEIKLSTGDGAAIENETTIRLRAHDSTELLLFDLP